eukprot:3282134-Rhodomonas_salina.1
MQASPTWCLRKARTSRTPYSTRCALSPYPLATPCSVLISAFVGIALRTCYAMSGTDTSVWGYLSTRLLCDARYWLSAMFGRRHSDPSPAPPSPRHSLLGTLLRMRYAMPGTDLRSICEKVLFRGVGAPDLEAPVSQLCSPKPKSSPLGRRSLTLISYLPTCAGTKARDLSLPESAGSISAMALRACYAMSGTDLCCAILLGVAIVQCPVLRWAMARKCSVLATRCPVLRQAMAMRCP